MPEPHLKDGVAEEHQLRSLAEGYAVRLYPLDEASELRLIDLWRVAWNGRWVILSLSVLLALAGIIAGSFFTPIYRAQVVLAPVTQDTSNALSTLAGSLGGIAALAGVNLGATDDTAAKSIAILQSREFTQRFIKKHGLMPVLFADIWNASTRSWDVSDPEDAPTLQSAFELFDRSIRNVTQDDKTGLVTMTIDWKDPVAASEWANAMIAEVNADVRTRAVEQSNKSIDFLRRELQSTTELELRTAVSVLMEAQMKSAMMATVKADYAFEVIDPAVVPEKKVWPKRMLLAVIGVAMGFLLGVLVVFVRHALISREPLAT